MILTSISEEDIVLVKVEVRDDVPQSIYRAKKLGELTTFGMVPKQRHAYSVQSIILIEHISIFSLII